MNNLEAYLKYTRALREAFSGHTVIRVPVWIKGLNPEPEELNMVLYGLDHGWIQIIYPSTAQKTGEIMYGLTEKGIKFLFPNQQGE